MNWLKACHEDDARCLAARVITAYSNQEQDCWVCAYGDHMAVTVGLGVRDFVKVDQADENTSSAPLDDDYWEVLADFISCHKREHILGYIGFDILYGSEGKQTPPTYPFIHLVVPEITLQVTSNSINVLASGTQSLPDLIGELQLCKCGSINTVSGLQFTNDKATHPGYLNSVKAALAWVKKGDKRRLTVAHRVSCNTPLDLAAGLVGSTDKISQLRSFYVRTPFIEFSGHSPELLAEGNAQLFHTGKLSGTYPRSTNIAEDDELRTRFIHDEKMLNEHQSSVDSTECSLKRIGEVHKQGPKIIDLPHIRHLLTTYETRPRTGTRVIDCLKAAFSTGAEPVNEGLSELCQLEHEGRGAYYGIVGSITPSEDFCFSQVLRTAFRDQLGWYFWVGAAVTGMSVPEDELEETMLKLSSIRVVPDGPQ